MNKDHRLAIILPAKNEERGVAAVIKEIRDNNISADIIVAEHGSTDKTVAVAESLGARVISCPHPGKGIGVRYVFSELAKDNRYAFFVMLDADYTYHAGYIIRISQLLKNNKADVVIGTRTIMQPGAMSQLHYIGNKALSLWASILYTHWANDILTGMWGLRADIIPKLNLTADKFTLEADLFAGAVLAKARIAEVPIEYRKRLGDTKLRWQDGVEIGKYLLKRRFQ